jgi:hypothetical protein
MLDVLQVLPGRAEQVFSSEEDVEEEDSREVVLRVEGVDEEVPRASEAVGESTVHTEVEVEAVTEDTTAGTRQVLACRFASRFSLHDLNSLIYSLNVFGTGQSLSATIGTSSRKSRSPGCKSFLFQYSYLRICTSTTIAIQGYFYARATNSTYLDLARFTVPSTATTNNSTVSTREMKSRSR